MREREMVAPDDQFRQWVADEANRIYEDGEDQGVAEAELANLLDMVAERFETAAFEADGVEADEGGVEAGYLRATAEVEAWLSLVSYVVARFYAPQSPFKRWPGRTLAGISVSVTRRLGRIARTAGGRLAQWSVLLRVDQVGISVQFPFGIGAGLGWNVEPLPRPVEYPHIRRVLYPGTHGNYHEFDIQIDEGTSVTLRT
jgi:hypothetical protein